MRLRGIHLFAIATACTFDTTGSSGGAGLSVGEAGGESVESGNDPTGPEDGSGEVGSAEGASTGTGDCAACAGPPPAGWSGPFALGEVAPSHPDPSCPDGWTRAALGHLELQAAAAQCGCDCMATAGTCVASASYCSDANCTAVVVGESSGGECQIVGTLLGYGYVTATGTAQGHGCTAVPMESIAPPSWAQALILCEPPPTPACDGGTCLPAVPDMLEDRWCVTQAGEHPCPPGEYSQAFVLWQGAADTRDCSACSCEVQGLSCPGVFREFADIACFVQRTQLPLDGACHPAASPADDAWGVRYDGTPPSFTCASSGSMPTGAAMPVDAVTFCCGA